MWPYACSMPTRKFNIRAVQLSVRLEFRNRNVFKIVFDRVIRFENRMCCSLVAYVEMIRLLFMWLIRMFL